MMQRIAATVLMTLAGGGLQAADPPLAPVSQRFADSNTPETPDFQRHVVPLLGTLGCNGRACHGSFQGQGGFRLSLFGYDFEADHAALAGGDEPRVDAKAPHDSLALLKPTRQIDHDGGKRLDIDSWQYRLLSKWIAGGAKPVADDAADFAALEIEPAEVLLVKAGESVQLRVIARWSDGSREDVTPLCRYQTRDESIAVIDAGGKITSAGPGDTHVVVFYDNGVVPVPVIRPVTNLTGPQYPAASASTKIDELVLAKLRKLGVVPSERCTDEEFLRRASLDLTGTLPLPEEVRAFAADQSADKRRAKIDELLSRPTYAAWWATKFGDWTGNGEQTGPVGGEQGLRRRFSELWYEWLDRRLDENVPYDQIAAGIVLATSRRPGQSFDEYCTEMSGYFRGENAADFAARETMPYFWSRRALGPNEEKARAFAYSFLGVRLECAQCHKHPFDQWTKNDFDQFAAFFNGVRYGAGNRNEYQAMKDGAGLKGLDEDSGDYKRKFVKLLEDGEVMPFKEVTVPPASSRAKRRPPKAAGGKIGRVITPRLLGGEQVLTEEYDDPRQPLMDWLRQEDNPYFARALVNRVWANHFGVGIVEPPDDMNLANPASNAALLDHLTREFVAHAYDLKWLHREILASDTYQRSWQPNETNRLDERNFSRAILRRLPAEAIYDALVQATAGADEQAALVHDDQRVRSRAIGLASGYSPARDEKLYAVYLFGKPAREVACDCERSSSPSLQQTLFLRNDAELLGLIDRKDGWLASLKSAAKKSAELPASDSLIDEAYLRTLNRLPTADERRTALAHLAEGEDPLAGLSGLLWALLNTKEFVVNH
ncbi:MAG TPA: DUF1549 and DUF1553 domain-containing protein [Pirellulaceae bacterium]|nr:DUF1549 and DUF1553 domain-containing protein [Pirellulaceae bacterium]